MKNLKEVKIMTNHKDIEVGMAEMKTDIKYIKKSQDENKLEHKELMNTYLSILEKLDNSFSNFESELNKKADKKELAEVSKSLNSKIIGGLIFLVTLLLSVLGFLIKHTLFG